MLFETPLSRAALIAQLVKNPPASRRPWFDSWVRKIPWRRDRLPTPVFLGFPCGSAGKESACNMGELGSIPGLGRSPGEGKGYPHQYSGLENSMDCIVYGVPKSWTGLSDSHFHFHHQWKGAWETENHTYSLFGSCPQPSASTDRIKTDQSKTKDTLACLEDGIKSSLP